VLLFSRRCAFGVTRWATAESQAGQFKAVAHGSANGSTLRVQCVPPRACRSRVKRLAPLSDLFHVEHVSDVARAWRGATAWQEEIFSGLRVSSAGLVSAAPRVSSEAVARELSGHRARLGLVERALCTEMAIGRSSVWDRAWKLRWLIHTRGTMQTGHRDACEALGAESRGLLWLQLKFPGQECARSAVPRDNQMGTGRCGRAGETKQAIPAFWLLRPPRKYLVSAMAS
jgi:hypothetical protein